MPVTSVSYFSAPGQPSFTTDVATVGPIVWIDPFEDVTARVLFRQAFQSSLTAYSPAALDTAYPSAVGGTTYILVKEGDFQEVGGNQLKWNRYYAATPPQRVEFTSSGRVFPGLISATFAREPIAFPAPTKITRDYYLVSTTGVGMPTLSEETKVTVTGTLNAPLLSEQFLTTFTNPTAATYLTTVSGDAATSASFSVRAEQDYLERWVGNFYARVRTEVKAK